MPTLLPTPNFLQASGVILDVRSPAEYAQGHVPGAVSFPLFSNAERALVGTCYKQEGRDQAVQLGLELVGAKLAEFSSRAKELAPERVVRVHCWRGGMRSEAIAWLLNLAGFQVTVMAGGYKAFRQWVLATVELSRPVIILGGMTGTGKTDILHELAERGEQILDLEDIANHRGSSFGNLELPPQPTNEQFENEIAVQWANLDPQRPVWVEAESKRIGTCRIPQPIFQQMDHSPVLEVVRDRAERLAILVDVYGTANLDDLIIATQRIRKRLGGLRTQQAVEFLQQGQLTEACDLILAYYDKTYTYDLERRQVPIYPVDLAGRSPAESADILLQQAKQVWSNAGCEINGTFKFITETQSAIV